MRRRSMFSMAFVVVVAGSLFAVPTAQAADEVAGTTAAAPRLVTTLQAPMSLVGFDAAQAAKVGNSVTTESRSQVLRNSRGVEIARVPIGTAAAKGSLGPANTVYGSCGSSFFYLYDLTGAAFALRTGSA